MQSVTSNAVAEAVGDINTVLGYAMLPREGGVQQTSAQFLASLVHLLEQRAPASFGSVDLTDGPVGYDAWYNYIWIPHRGGIGGDNYLYGTCILVGMTINTSAIWQNHFIGGNWYGWLGNG